MSRWIEQFDAHPFQKAWSALKENLEESNVDDETVITSVQELARLKKVISYVDEIINGLDIDLIPPATWDNINAQATPCDSQISQYNSDKNIAHIKQANVHADNLLTYVRPYMVAKGKVAKTLQNSLRSYANTINRNQESFQENTTELIESIRKDKEQGDSLSKELSEISQSMNDYRIELFGDEDEIIGLKKEIEQHIEDFEEKYLRFNEFYNEVLVGDAEELSTKKEVIEAKESIESDKEKIRVMLEEVENQVKELGEFHIKIFGEKADDDELEEGLSGDLDELMTKLEDFEEEQKVRYETLNKQIEGLIPGATDAGLATAYRAMKKTFDDPIVKANRLFYWSIAGLVAVSFLVVVQSISSSGIEFIELDNWSSVLKRLVTKLPFYLPVLWLAFFATRRRSENQRLQQEYAHKESLAKSYSSYKQQIMALGDEDGAMQKVFLMKAIDAIAYNASKTLDGKHGDKMPLQELVEKTVDVMLKNRGDT